MKTFEIQPKRFWEEKILDWENSRYGTSDYQNQSLLESLAGRASASLRFRLQLAVQLLVPYIRGKRVVELGCGSGLLTESLIARGARSYLGVDISEKAVAAARERMASLGLSRQATFIAGDVLSLPDFEGDIILSLGLLDWLTLSEIKQVFEQTRGLQFVHSFSEKRLSLGQMIHRAYVKLSYGHRTGSYIPRYYKANELIELAAPYAPEEIRVVTDSRLSFGAFLTALSSSPSKQGSPLVSNSKQS